MKIAIVYRSGSKLQHAITSKVVQYLKVEPTLISLSSSWREKFLIANGIRQRIGFINLIYFVVSKYLESKCITKLSAATSISGGTHVFSFDLKSEKLIDFLQAERFDLIVLGQSFVLPKRLINCVQNKIVNVHPAKLPQYRGYAEPAHAILEGKTSDVGFSIHLVSTKVDKGDLIKFVQVATLPFESLNMTLTRVRLNGYDYLFEKLAMDGVPNFLLAAAPQDDSSARTVTILSLRQRFVLDLKIFFSHLKS